jgi:ubiquinone/menaquinone biosynthesis C-methylase UbiE
MFSSIESGRFNFLYQAAKLADTCPVSGNDGYMLLDCYGLAKQHAYDAEWKDYKGKRILDVCSGVSDLTARLISYGADAYALDFGYADLNNLLKRAGKIKLAHEISSSDQDQVNEEIFKQPIILDKTSHFFSSYRSYLLQKIKDDLFIKSITKTPERYVAGFAHEIPFPSESFDAVVSSFGVFGVMDNDYDLLKLSVEEMIRVLQPDGHLRIVPLLPNRKDFSETEKTNQKRLIQDLQKREDIIISPRYPDRGHRTIDELGQLAIQKAP